TKAFGDRAGFRLDPADARPASAQIDVDGALRGGRRTQDLGEHERIFHGHAAALPHHRRTCMGGIADEEYAARVPPLKVNPPEGVAVYRFVGVESREILMDVVAELGKAAAQSLEPPLGRIVQARLGNVSKAISAALADRAEPEETAVAEHKPQRGRAR